MDTKRAGGHLLVEQSRAVISGSSSSWTHRRRLQTVDPAAQHIIRQAIRELRHRPDPLLACLRSLTNLDLIGTFRVFALRALPQEHRARVRHAAHARPIVILDES
jgi:hypothetical protein